MKDRSRDEIDHEAIWITEQNEQWVIVHGIPVNNCYALFLHFLVYFIFDVSYINAAVSKKATVSGRIRVNKRVELHQDINAEMNTYNCTNTSVHNITTLKHCTEMHQRIKLHQCIKMHYHIEVLRVRAPRYVSA